MRPKRSLGQNFLVDPNLQRKVVGELGLRPGEGVLEVGPGRGELSRHLVGAASPLVAVEKDEALAEALERRWAVRDDVRIVRADALEADLARLVPPPPYRVISNLPYNITSPLLFAFLDLEPPPERIVVTVQAEVAERIVAPPGSRTYGALSVGVQARAGASLAFRLPRSVFRPTPRVDSAAVRIDPDPERLAELPADALRRLTRAAFGRRRKQLQKILRTAPEYRLSRAEAEAMCEALGLDPRARPERVPADLFVRLARRLDER